MKNGVAEGVASDSHDTSMRWCAFIETCQPFVSYKKYVPPFASKNIFPCKRRNLFQYKNTVYLLVIEYFRCMQPDNHWLDNNVNAMVFYPRYGLILSNIQRNWFAISSEARRARKVLQFNFEECWTVLIHTSDKRPSHSHCYQVNDCQVTYIKKTVLLKGGQYFCTVKTIRSTFY